MNAGKNILLVEDDPNFGIVLRDYLKMNGYKVDLAENGKIGYSNFRSNSYDLCILDVMMPEMDGFSLAELIAKQESKTPLVFLTAKSLKKDIIKGYQLGASDYLNKPFDPEILLLKINAILEKPGEHFSEPQESVVFLDYTLNYPMRNLSKNGIEVKKLSPRENQLLFVLLDKCNQLVRREEVLTRIWKENNYFTARSMDVYVNKLRKLFSNDERISIDNIRGDGFCMKVNEG
ncbi:MAG: response regulator transcription factor [Bacteroidia bacterium]